MHEPPLREPTDPAARPGRSAAAVVVELDHELLLLDPRTNGLHQLDATASVIWSILDGDGTVDELVDDLADAYGADSQVVRRDLEFLLDRLAYAGLLDGTSPPDHMLVGAFDAPRAVDDGLWRPTYLIDPPAP